MIAAQASSWTVGRANTEKPSSARARTRTQPNAAPMTSAVVRPNAAISSASQRMVERTWPRLAPTARVSPISRVRSTTDNTSVFTMPIMAMTIVSTSSAR